MKKEDVEEFKKELEGVINRYSIDNDLDMPDYIIASLIYSNIDNLIKAHEANKAWHGGRVL